MPERLKTTNAFANAISSGNLSVVHFSADWAEQCGQIDDVLDALSSKQDYKQVKFYNCIAEELSEISLKYNVEAVPTVLYFRSGKEIDRVNGADAAKVTAKVNEHAQNELNQKEAVPLEERLKTLINKSKVMLFMKGDRNAPRCGFSRQIVQILNDTGVLYETFDILTDEEVRQGLKTYSDWPTYPQLYVNGELIGGLDIVKEMLASGELSQALGK